MGNRSYNASGAPGFAAVGASVQIRNEFEDIAAGFAELEREIDEKEFAAAAPSEWVNPVRTPTFVSGTQFRWSGSDLTGVMVAGRRVRCTVNGAHCYSEVQDSSYASGVTTVTLSDAILTSQLSLVEYGVLTPVDNPSASLSLSRLAESVIGTLEFAGATVTPTDGGATVAIDGEGQVLRPDDVVSKGPWVDVRAFGAKGDGVTDDSSAFVAAINAAAALRRADLGGGSNPLGGCTILLPRGDYLIKSAGALSFGSFVGRTVGLTFASAGVGGAQILYQPTSPGALVSNDDKILLLRFKGILFHCNDSNSSLMDSASNGGAQDYAFEDCSFTGSWKYGINLTGTNNNSEFKFNGCSFSGSWLAFLYSGASGTSDQFLNYWFVHCKYWSSSPWIDMAAGGSIRITDSDVSGYAPAQLAAGQGPDANRTVYLFNLRGSSHSRGVCSLAVQGTRFEQKTQWAGVAYSEWEQGYILFDGCDFGSQAFQAYAASVQSIFINPGNTAGAEVQFRQCIVMGQHVYRTLMGGVGAARVAYDGTDFLNYAVMADAFSFVDGGGQSGRRPTVRLRNCRGTNVAAGYAADGDLNWNLALVGHTSKKIVSLKTAFGNLPRYADGSQTVILPVGAVITRIIIYIPSSGANTSGATGTSYTVQTGEGTPTVLATLAMAGALSLGGNVDQSVFFPCSSTAKATISIVPSAGIDQASSNSYCIIEYIG